MKTSKKILLGVTTALLFTGCDLLKEDGVVNLTTKPFAKVYVDGKYIQESSYGVTKLIVKEGNRKIKVEGVSPDGNTLYKGEQEVLVEANKEKNAIIITYASKTEKKIKEDEVLAKQYGCKDIQEYDLVNANRKDMYSIMNALPIIEKMRNDYKKNNGAMIDENSEIVLTGFTLNGKYLSYNIKNKSSKTLESFKITLHFFDEKLNYLGVNSFYQDTYISNKIKAGGTAKFEKDISRVYNGKVTARDLHEAGKFYLVAYIPEYTLEDNLGEISKKNETKVTDKMLKNLNDSMYETFKNDLVELEKSLVGKCSGDKEKQ
jgi:hypothetical protein